MNLKFVQFLFLLEFGIAYVSGHWTYGQQNDAQEWIGQCTTGKHQSPIEISTNKTVPISMNPFIFEFYSNPPKAESLTNNGHSVTFTLKAEREITYPKVVGGGLPGVFQFEQFHFHWGSVDQRGSEHNIDGAKHPMELHLVHFNSMYGSNLGEAMNNSKAYDTIAAISILFEIQKEDNPAMEPITEALKFIKFQNEVVNNVTLFPLEHLLPKDKDHFFRYNGSLTTPPCDEVVIWTIFQEPIYISENQMNKFRLIDDLPKSNDTFESESDNFRDLQEINDRTIYIVDTLPLNVVQNDAPSNDVKNPTTATTPAVDKNQTTSVSVDMTSKSDNAKSSDKKEEEKKDEKTDVSSIDVKEESKTSEHDGHAEGHDGHDGHDEHEGHAGGHDGHDEHADGKSSANKYLISPLVSFSIFCILSFIA